MKYIGIDPGINGGVAVIDNYYSIKSFKCPSSPMEMAEALKNSIDGNSIALLEKVHSFPGQGVVSTFTFGTNYGQWQGILASQDIHPEYVSPRKWMDLYSTPYKMDRKSRKRYSYRV